MHGNAFSSRNPDISDYKSYESDGGLKKDFSGDAVHITDPSFDLCDLVRKALASQQAEDPADDLLTSLFLSSSPLTSLETTPCATPIMVDDRIPHLHHSAIIEGTITALQDMTPIITPDALTENVSSKPTRKRKRARTRKEEGQRLDTTEERRNKRHSKANRKKKKQRQAESSVPMPPVSSKVHHRHVERMQPVQCANDMKHSSNYTKNAYVGKKSTYDCETTYVLDDLVGESSRFKFRLVKWDGITPKPILDTEGRMIAHLGGQPDEPSWKQDVVVAANLLEAARGECQFSKDEHHQRPRGPFPILRCGISHGGGQVRPRNISHRDTKKNCQIIQRLNRAPAFRRISDFSSSVFASWAPQLYKYYEDTSAAIYRKYPNLERPFPRSVFSATTYNMGPCTVCFPHTDLANLAYGWCAIVALGDYDPTLGGHLVLWDCKIVVEFPPGSLVLIPSAVIAHSNTPIQPHEHRYSFTQYTAGAIFRWVDQEFQSQKEYQASKSKSQLKEIDEKLRKRWENGLALLPRLHIQV
ncbi:hypothetical protein BJ165DRAFT_1535577 [Panaeolus papilionaceus]|nr:hypothetical protein BJ165DRAFT_1535577 [Panaeolus papilionaceus]